MTQVKAQTPRRNSRILKYAPKNDDSPSRQLLRDLERALGQIQLHETELQKVRAFNRRSYVEDLDARDLERTQADIAALDAATARHDAVRHDAEAALQTYIREVEEAERVKREEEARIRREREAREKAEREQREREEAGRKAKIEREKAAAAKKAADEKAKADAEEARRKEREETVAREKAEKERLAKEASDKEQAERAAADEKAAQDAAAQKATQDAQTRAQPSMSRTSELEEIHNRYLDLHKKLKKFRTEFAAAAKTNPQLKPKVGDMRRAMKVSVGQLTDDKKTNKKPVSHNAPLYASIHTNTTADRPRQNNPHGFPHQHPLPASPAANLPPFPHRRPDNHHPVLNSLFALHLHQSHYLRLRRRMRCQPKGRRANRYASGPDLLVARTAVSLAKPTEPGTTAYNQPDCRSHLQISRDSTPPLWHPYNQECTPKHLSRPPAHGLAPRVQQRHRRRKVICS